jgi:hypothetical protein
MKMSMLDRLLLLAAAILAAYQIVVGIDQLSAASILAYTISFGVLLVAALMMIILGFEALDSAVVVIVSTIIPLSMALGLAWDNLPQARAFFLVFAVLGLAGVIVTRSLRSTPIVQTIVLTIVHGVAGLTIFLLPIQVAMQGRAHPAFALVGLGGALIGSAGLMLSFLKIGRPVLKREIMLRLFPGLLFLMTACFAAGFLWGS